MNAIKQLRRKIRRGFDSAKSDRLTAELSSFPKSLNSQLKSESRVLRSRARDVCNNNDYAKKFLQMVKANVVGNNGIALQSQAKQESGQPDNQDRETIETAWKKWGSLKHCTMSGRLSFKDVQTLVIESIARDGEVLVQMVNDGEFGLSLHVIDADYLDENHNVDLKNGNRIIMGVEVDQWFEPVAYHLLTNNPSEDTSIFNGKKYQRVDADKILHLYLQTAPEQVRGVTWLATAIRRLAMLGGYEEAELVSARVSSSKMGFYITPSGDEYVGDDVGADGEIINEAEPAVFEQLPEGWDFKQFDPQHPPSAFDSFIKATLRGISSGLNVAYNSLANDLEGVNFSSIRSGVLEEREQWRTLQSWLIEHFCTPVFEKWLDNALASGALQLPPRKRDKFADVKWQPRGWSWVDPLKDQQASQLALDLGLTTRSDLASQQGKDFEDILKQLQSENELMQQYNIKPQVKDDGQTEDSE